MPVACGCSRRFFFLLPSLPSPCFSIRLAPTFVSPPRPVSQELRTEVLSKAVDIDDMERGVRQSISAVKNQIQRIHTCVALLWLRRERTATLDLVLPPPLPVLAQADGQCCLGRGQPRGED